MNSMLTVVFSRVYNLSPFVFAKILCQALIQNISFMSFGSYRVLVFAKCFRKALLEKNWIHFGSFLSVCIFTDFIDCHWKKWISRWLLFSVKYARYFVVFFPQNFLVRFWWKKLNSCRVVPITSYVSCFKWTFMK